METPSSQQKNVLDNAILKPISAITRALHAIIRFFIGLVSFIPITILFVSISFFVSDLYRFNTNTDDFMVAYFCSIPALIGSLIGGIIGGEIGYRKSYKYLGAILGGLCGPFITLLLLSIKILSEWASY